MIVNARDWLLVCECEYNIVYTYNGKGKEQKGGKAKGGRRDGRKKR